MKPAYGLILAALVVMPATGLHAQDGGEDPRQAIDATRESLAKWMETQQIISREKKDWQTGREVLTQRIELVKGEIEALSAKIAETRAGITEADQARARMLAESESLESASDALTATVTRLESKTRALMAELPLPLRERVAPLSQRLPKEAAGSDLSLSERYQNVIGILNEVNRFNRDITVVSEVRPLPSGTTAEVKTLYLGLGQGYYVTADGKTAGVGRPGPDGWQWQADDSLAPAVTQAIAILQNESVPAFVPLPVSIR